MFSSVFLTFLSVFGFSCSFRTVSQHLWASAVPVCHRDVNAPPTPRSTNCDMFTPCALTTQEAWLLMATHGNSWNLIGIQTSFHLFESEGHPFPCNYNIDSRCKKKGLRRVYTSEAASQHPNCIPMLASHPYCRYSCQAQWSSIKSALSMQRIARSSLYAPWNPFFP